MEVHVRGMGIILEIGTKSVTGRGWVLSATTGGEHTAESLSRDASTALVLNFTPQRMPAINGVLKGSTCLMAGFSSACVRKSSA